MKKIILFLLALLLLLTGCLSNTHIQETATSMPKETQKQTPAPQKCLGSSGIVYLFGEQHSVQAILDKELELWQEYYTEKGMRHLFVELPYYTAQYLNLWMQDDDDIILYQLYDDWVGTATQSLIVIEFYRSIKVTCPQTIFHGTDVGHQYNSTGKRYKEYLEENGLDGTDEYALTLEAIQQGIAFYENRDAVYRENMMTKNFVREFDALSDENVMGIYGNAHTDTDAMDHTGKVACMAKQLVDIYPGQIISESLIEYAKNIPPLRVDMITVEEKEYEALYFGETDISQFESYATREFWRLEGAWEDFKDCAPTGEVLPYSNYPMLIEIKQVFMIVYHKSDGSSETRYYRSDGAKFDGEAATSAFVFE